MEARLSIDVDKPELVKRAIQVDERDGGSIKSEFSVGDKLDVRIKSDGLSNLRAGINTILRLIKISKSATVR